MPVEPVPEIMQPRHEHQLPGIVRARNDHMILVRYRARLRDRALDPLEPAGNPVIEAAPGLVQTDPRPRPLEHPDGDLLLQPRDVPADGGLRRLQLFRRTGEAAETTGGLERDEGTQRRNGLSATADHGHVTVSNGQRNRSHSAYRHYSSFRTSPAKGLDIRTGRGGPEQADRAPTRTVRRGRTSPGGFVASPCDRTELGPAEPTSRERPNIRFSPSMRRPSGAPGDGRRIRGRSDRFAWRAGAVGRRRGGGGSISPGGASREAHCRRGDAGGAFPRRRAEGGHGGDTIDAVPAGIAGRPAATGFRIGDERAGRRSPTWTGAGSPSPPIPGRARGPRRSRRRSAVPSGPRFGGPVRANATPGSARMPASPGPIGRGSSGSGSPVPIPARADRLIHIFEGRGDRGPLSSRLAAVPWQRLAALDRSPEFPGGTKRRSTRYSESGFFRAPAAPDRLQQPVFGIVPTADRREQALPEFHRVRPAHDPVPGRYDEDRPVGEPPGPAGAAEKARARPVTRHGYPCPRRGRSRRVRVVPS